LEVEPDAGRRTNNLAMPESAESQYEDNCGDFALGDLKTAK